MAATLKISRAELDAVRHKLLAAGLTSKADAAGLVSYTALLLRMMNVPREEASELFLKAYDEVSAGVSPHLVRAFNDES